jgi:hypothetical protein
MIEAGLEPLGVPPGVPLGVLDALSTLAFLEEDLGVIFELRKVLTGVDKSSFKFPFGVPPASLWAPRRRVGDMEVDAMVDVAILGVSGALDAIFAALKVGINGRPAPPAVFCLSYGIYHNRFESCV